MWCPCAPVDLDLFELLEALPEQLGVVEAVVLGHSVEGKHNWA